MIWERNAREERVRFGRRVRTMRKIRGFRLQDVADKTGMSVWFLSGVERGEKPVSAEMVRVIAEALGVGVKLLAEGNGEFSVPVAGGAVRFEVRGR